MSNGPYGSRTLSGAGTIRDTAPRLGREPARPSRAGPAARQAARFAIRVVRADLANFFLLQYRALDGFLITGKNSGTHWVKYMLSCAIARHYGVAPPAYASGRAGDAIIGHPRWKPTHPQIPRIGSSHTIPSIAFSWPIKLFRPAPVVLLVRDIRQALLSNYVKWRDDYGVPLSDYASGDPSGARFVADIWWYIHFFNRWGDVARAWPDRVLVVHYEDVQLAPAVWLRRMAAHLGIELTDDSIAAALPYVGRDAVRALLDPNHNEVVVPEAQDRSRLAFSEAEEATLRAILRRHLRHDLGYDLPRAPRGRPTPPSGEAARAQ